MVGAHVRLEQGDPSQIQDVQTGDQGQFSFAKVVPGDFRLTITYKGFGSHSFSSVLLAGQAYLVPPIVLMIEHDVTQVSVKITPTDVAQAQIQRAASSEKHRYPQYCFSKKTHNMIHLLCNAKALEWRLSASFPSVAHYGVSLIRYSVVKK